MTQGDASWTHPDAASVCIPHDVLKPGTTAVGMVVAEVRMVVGLTDERGMAVDEVVRMVVGLAVALEMVVAAVRMLAALFDAVRIVVVAVGMVVVVQMVVVVVKGLTAAKLWKVTAVP